MFSTPSDPVRASSNRCSFGKVPARRGHYCPQQDPRRKIRQLLWTMSPPGNFLQFAMVARAGEVSVIDRSLSCLPSLLLHLTFSNIVRLFGSSRQITKTRQKFSLLLALFLKLHRTTEKRLTTSRSVLISPPHAIRAVSSDSRLEITVRGVMTRPRPARAMSTRATACPLASFEYLPVQLRAAGSAGVVSSTGVNRGDATPLAIDRTVVHKGLDTRIVLGLSTMESFEVQLTAWRVHAVNAEIY